MPVALLRVIAQSYVAWQSMDFPTFRRAPLHSFYGAPFKVGSSRCRVSVRGGGVRGGGLELSRIASRTFVGMPHPMCFTIASPNSLHFSFVAPSIIR